MVCGDKVSYILISYILRPDHIFFDCDSECLFSLMSPSNMVKTRTHMLQLQFFSD